MSATVSQYGWAAPDDWERYRETITNIYFYQNKKLRELKVIMEQEYHFFATDKMYKSHFKQWNLHKNSKHQRSGESSSSKDKSHKSSSSSNHGSGGGSSSRA